MNFILPTVKTLMALRARMNGYEAEAKRTALLPTMGALHEGHLSLVRIAKRAADRVIVSIFVNPTQFAPDEDFEAYPRNLQSDLELLAEEGVDLVYLPARADMYHEDHSTRLIIEGFANGLETDHRPTFFHGVALVVNKLLNRVRPDMAVFGEKDFQQLAVIRRMVRDLDIPVKIIGAPIARDAQGLALSSRNRYLDEDGLAVARQLNRILFDARDQLQNGVPVAATLKQARRDILDSGFSDVDYVSLADASSLELQEAGPVKDPMQLLIAAHCQGVRLIDNCAVNAPTTEDSSP